MGQTDGRIVVSLNAPLKQGQKKRSRTYSLQERFQQPGRLNKSTESFLWGDGGELAGTGPIEVNIPSKWHLNRLGHYCMFSNVSNTETLKHR